MSPNICVNARFLTQPLVGMPRYAYNIVKRLPFTRLITPESPRLAYSSLPSSQIYVLPHLLKSHLWEQFVLPNVIPNGDVLWTPAAIGPFRSSCHVLSIPDVSIIEHPEWYSQAYALWYNFLLPHVARRARKIITISNFSKERIIETLSIPEQNIIITYPGVDNTFYPQSSDIFQQVLQEYNINNPYILAVGAIATRKNFSKLLEAWNFIANLRKDIWLVIVGEKGLPYFSTSSTGKLPPRTLHLTGVDDEHLVCLYNGALAFVYPSLYEGFGLPVLEAMACGTPVVTSDVSSLPEVAGTNAIMVNPYDIDSIIQGILQIIDSEYLRKELSLKGLDWVKHFSWDKTAALTWKILQDVANSQR